VPYREQKAEELTAERIIQKEMMKTGSSILLHFRLKGISFKYKPVKITRFQPQERKY